MKKEICMNGNILTICIGKRGAIGDSYKNILNSFQEKESIICMIPASYRISEFSSDFHFRFIEKISNESYRNIKRILFLKEIYKEIKHVRELIKKKNIIKVFVYSDGNIFIPFLSLFLRDFKLEWIIWIHDPVLHLGVGFNARFSRVLARYIVYPKVIRFIVSYKEAKRSLRKLYKIPDDKIDVIYLPRMKEAEYPLRNENTRYDFIFWGRIEEYKGLDLLLKVFKDRDLKDMSLLIIGKGKNENLIKTKIKNMKNVTFINRYVKYDELAKMISESKIVILPYKEATGSQTVAIANYYGKMVLATRVGCFKEYIVENENGFYINEYSYDGIKKAILCLKDKDLSQYTSGIRRHLGKFDLRKISGEIEKLINKI